MQAITYELKYCERCGSLRLRPADSAETYCQPCEQALLSVPVPGALRSKLLLHKPPVHKDGQPVLQGEAQLVLEPLCGELSPQAKSPGSVTDLCGRLQ